MATDLRQNPALQAELDILMRLSTPSDSAIGRYGMTPMHLVDAVANGVKVPADVASLVGEWDSKSMSEKYQTQSDLQTWMKQHPSVNDRIAERYYEGVVRNRAGGSGHAALLMWSDPGATMKDMESLGIDSKDLSTDPKALKLLLQHIEQNGSEDRRQRVSLVRHLSPMLDYAKTIQPIDPMEKPALPTPILPKEPVPYPSMETTDKWLQYGHSAAYQESIKDYGDILGHDTMQAALQLRTGVDRDTNARRLLGRAYTGEALESVDGPVDMALELGVAPYGIAKATADIIHTQLAGDMDLTQRLKEGVFAAPLIVGSIFAGRFAAAGRSGVRGMTEAAPAEKVQEAKDVFTQQLTSARQVRQGIETRLKTYEAAGDVENAKKAKRELSQARRKENFLATILDNEKGEAEIRRLEYWKQGLQEEGASLAQIKDVDRRIAAAQRRLVDAQEALKLPTKQALNKSLETWQNLKKSAKVPDEQMHSAAEELVRSGKVSLETIMSRGIDKALNPIEAQAEAMVANKLADHIDALAKVYAKSDGSIIATNELVNTLNAGAIVLGKVRRSDTRLGQAVHALAGKSSKFEGLIGTVEGLDNMTLPAFVQTFQTAKTDIDKVAQLRKLAQPGVFKGSAMQLITNNLISSPSTATWNVISMGAMTLSRMNELRLLGKLDPKHFAQDEAGTFASALVGYYGRLLSGDVKAKEAWNEAFQKASLRSTGIDEGITTKYNFRNTISAQRLGLTGLWGRAVDTAGYAINLPTQVSAWADAAVSVGIKDAMAKTLAHRRATLELQAEQDIGAKLTKAQMDARILAREQEILADENANIMVDGKPYLIRDLAAEDASVISMMGKLQSQSLGGVESWMNNSLIARMVIPFPHPFLQTAEMALERTPIGRLLPNMKADLAAGGARAAAARAKLATGNQTAALFAMFAGTAYAADEMGAGDWIGYTGSGPFRENQKSLWAATHRADTLRIAGKEFPLSKLGPVGQVMSATADVMGLINEGINVGDKAFTDTAIDLTARLSAAWTTLVVSELFAADVKDIVHGLVQGNAAAVERVLERKATMAVPAGALVKDVMNIVNDVRQVYDTTLSELKFVTPLNFWGDPTRYYGTQNPLATLIGLTERNAPDFERKNKIAEQLIADDVGVSAPGKNISVNGVDVELTLDQMYAMREFFGYAKFEDHGTLVDGLEKMISNPLYRSLAKGSGEDSVLGTRLSKGSKQAYINMLVSARKEAAAKWLLSPEPISGVDFPVSPFAHELQGKVKMAVQSRQWEMEHPSTPNTPGTAGTLPFAFPNMQ